MFGNKLKLTVSALAMMMVAAAPVSAQSLLRIDDSPIGELDPHKAVDDADSYLAYNLYDTLVIPNKGSGGVQPHLATEWTVEDNIVTFTLRDDVTFHSGNALTAADVVYSFERMTGMGRGFANLFDNVTSAEAIDDTTVRFTLEGPSAPFLPALVRLPIVDSAVAQEHATDGDYASDWFSANEAGSGAYEIVSHNPQEESELTKNDDFFLDIPEAAPETVILRYGIAPSTMRGLMQSGEHEIASPYSPPEMIRDLAEEDNIELMTMSGGWAYHIKLNTLKAPLDDVNCRLALTYAVDYDALRSLTQINDEFAQGSPSNGPIPTGMLGHDDAPMYARDMDRAREYLDACEYDPATAPPIEISWNSDVPIQERFSLLLQANFAELGFQSELMRGSWAQLTGMMSNPETTPHMFQIWAAPLTPDPDSLLYPTYHTSQPRTFLSMEGFNTPELDAMLDESRVLLDEEEREAKFQEIGAYLRDNAPTIYAFEYQAVLSASDRVTAPTLTDDDERYGLNTFNYSFREIEIAE